MSTVGIAELRHLSRYLEHVAKGERLIVTDRNRPVAELGPPAAQRSALDALDALVAEGRITRPRRVGLPEPLSLRVEPLALSHALDETRGER